MVAYPATVFHFLSQVALAAVSFASALPVLRQAEALAPQLRAVTAALRAALGP